MTSKTLPRDLPACPVETTLLLLSNKWSVLILRDLFDQPRRFGQLQKSIGSISQKVLTANLRSLEEKGVKVAERLPIQVNRNPHNEGYLDVKAVKLGHLFTKE